MLEEHKDECVAAIHAKVSQVENSDSAVVCATAKTQYVASPELFLTEDDWGIVTSAPSVHHRVVRLAERFSQLGLLYPSEPTVKGIVAIALLNQGDPAGLLASAVQNIRVYMNHLMIIRQRLGAVNLPGFTLPIHEFKQKYPTWYGSGYGDGAPASTIPIDVFALKSFTAQLGCRVSKAGVAKPSASLQHAGVVG